MAQAMGGHCQHASATAEVHAHPAMSDVSMQGSDRHAHHHHAGMDHAQHTPAKSTAIGCSCACACGMAGCVGSSAGITSAVGAMSLTPLSDIRALLPSTVALRAARGLDLIRPPSKS